jgi:uncharacterized repeat protein (TIGR03833 family)
MSPKYRAGRIETGISTNYMNGNSRSNIKPEARVQVVQKQDQRTGKLTEGTVKDILTKSSTHPHGIKVRLTNGVVGRVKIVLPE